MKNSRLQKIISLFVLQVYFTTQAIAFDGVVLCQSNDGHVAIEFGNGGHCAELPLKNFDSHKHSNNSNHSIIECELNHCGDCDDIPLTIVPSNDSLQKSNTPLRPSEERAPPPFFAINNQQKQSLAAELPSKFPPIDFPSFLRTTVLLI